MAESGKLLDDVIAFLGAGGVMHLIDRFFLLRKEKAEAGKINADTDNTVSSAWREHVDSLQAESAQLRAMVEDLWAKRRTCEEALAQVSAEIIQLKAALSNISRRSDLTHE